MEVGCQRKRYLGFEYDETGYVSATRNEDLTIGSAVHAAVDVLIKGGSFADAMVEAKCSYHGAPPWADYLMPEQKEILTNDGIALVHALVYAFYVVYLPTFMAEYETLEAESEINWLVRELDEGYSGKYFIVCMSRPDAILRHKASGKLWHVSHKTAKRFDQLSVQRLTVDIQRFAESLAIQAKYGEEVEGTLYNYFLKGTKTFDPITSMDRYTTGLIRPYIYRQVGGEITPESLSFGYEWNHVDTTTGVVSKKRLNKGWERCSIYNEMDFGQYLEWLQQKWILREGHDYLMDSIAGMIPMYWDQDAANRWLLGIQQSEDEWADRVSTVGGKANLSAIDTSYFIPLASKECFSYNSRCAYFPICWEGREPDDLLAEGSFIKRTPNHPIESNE